MTEKTDPKGMNLRLSADPSKAEEIEVVEKLANWVRGQDWYLTSFITPELASWVASNIRNDFPSDIYAYYTEAQKEVGRGFKQLEEELMTLKAELIRKEERIARQEASLEDWSEDLTSKRKRIVELLKAFDEVSTRAEEAERDLDAAHEEIVRLKAKLYDALVENKISA